MNRRLFHESVSLMDSDMLAIYSSADDFDEKKYRNLPNSLRPFIFRPLYLYIKVIEAGTERTFKVDLKGSTERLS